jgi:hypothetical protein
MFTVSTKASARKHNLLDDDDRGLYDELDQIRQLRNRIHIQNKKNELEPNERSAFTPARKISAEEYLEVITKNKFRLIYLRQCSSRTV